MHQRYVEMFNEICGLDYVRPRSSKTASVPLGYWFYGAQTDVIKLLQSIIVVILAYFLPFISINFWIAWH